MMFADFNSEDIERMLIILATALYPEICLSNSALFCVSLTYAL
jgi:hypothetical protein